MNVLEIKNLFVSYGNLPSNSWVLDNISFNVPFGDYVCIIGNNGAGKSTLIKSILGLIPKNKGDVLLHCEKSDVAYIPQICSIPESFPATIREIILSGTQKPSLAKLPFYSKKDKAIAEKAIETVELTNFSSNSIGELSGGQRQRVLLSRALCKNPKLLILDEPCSGLDKKASENFYKLLKKLNIDHKTTILMISHDLVNVEKYAKRVIHLEKKILFDGSSKNYFNKKGVNVLA